MLAKEVDSEISSGRGRSPKNSDNRGRDRPKLVAHFGCSPTATSMSSEFMLPGQPIPLLRGPVPQLGNGTYIRDGQVRASLVGVPRYEGSVCVLPLFFSQLSRINQFLCFVIDTGYISCTASAPDTKFCCSRICHPFIASAGYAFNHSC
jgi:hypothetical protein